MRTVYWAIFTLIFLFMGGCVSKEFIDRINSGYTYGSLGESSESTMVASQKTLCGNLKKYTPSKAKNLFKGEIKIAYSQEYNSIKSDMFTQEEDCDQPGIVGIVQKFPPSRNLWTKGNCEARNRAWLDYAQRAPYNCRIEPRYLNGNVPQNQVSHYPVDYKGTIIGLKKQKKPRRPARVSWTSRSRNNHLDYH